MADMDGLVDFDLEAPFVSNPVISKKSNKVIGLDDLLTDYYKEQGKLVERESKQAKVSIDYDTDDEQDKREAEVSKCVNNCQEMMAQISNEDDFSLWGLQLFGSQKSVPPSKFSDIGSCMIMQSFMNNELKSLIENFDRGASFLEGLLTNGWLLKLVHESGCIEKSIAVWTFNLMLYSPREALMSSACDFWCAILLSKNEEDQMGIKIDWLPSYADLETALKTYGFLLNSHSTCLSNTEMVHEDSNSMGPPPNIRAWIKYIAACCQVRGTHSIFLASEVEELVGMILFLFLDRQLLGLSVILHLSWLSVINFFTDSEWTFSCEKAAKFVACRVPTDSNSLRIVESISGVNARTKHLRSTLAFQILVTCFNGKVYDAEGLLRLLILINVKDKGCDLFKVYIYLCLTENWLSSNSKLESNPVIHEIWGVYLRNCSCQITSSDLRPYASKVRSKASYLLQGSNS